MIGKVQPKDTKSPYHTEVAQYTHYILDVTSRYAEVLAKVQPKDPKCPYPTQEPQGTYYILDVTSRYTEVHL